VVVALIVLFPVAIAAAGAFRSADPGRVELVRSFGGSRWDVIRHVTVPGAVPAIFDGLRISAAYSVAGAAIAEQIGGARSGLGLYIARSQRSFRADQVLAGVVMIAVLSLLVYAAVGLAARRAAPWAPASGRDIA
jgi:ABC-type nitrate/sulfonate/bicarbonate transport system permease component